jgi:hypothetical protein
MLKFVIAGLLAGIPFAPAVAQSTPIIVNGRCDAKSGVTIDDGEMTALACDTGVVMRSDRGTVLIQFTDKAGDDGRIVGFAGTIEGKQGFGADAAQIMAVERIYLAGGAAPVPASRGTCIMNWTGLQRTGGRLSSVVCGAVGSAEGSLVKAMVVLKAD